MGQVKKPEVREAILDTALQLFSRKGYARTTLEEIARGSGVSTANVYVYFRSKLEILYAIYDPWMRERLTSLENKIAALDEPRKKLRLLLTTLWRDIPAEKHGFVNNIMQAISSATPRDRYRPDLLKWMEAHLDRMLRASLPAERNRKLRNARLAHLLVMAFNGYIIYHHINPRAALDEDTVEAVAAMLLGEKS
jgi:AcrR family transcriptional regulator